MQAILEGRPEVVSFIDITRQLLGKNRKVMLVVEGSGPDIDLPGGATAIIPNLVTITASLAGRGIQLDVGRSQIMVKWGILRGSIESISVVPERIHVGIRGLPDVTIGINP